MNKYRQIIVAPYAVLSAIKALETCGVREMVLTKQDSNLVIRWNIRDEEPLPKSLKETCTRV